MCTSVVCLFFLFLLGIKAFTYLIFLLDYEDFETWGIYSFIHFGTPCTKHSAWLYNEYVFVEQLDEWVSYDWRHTLQQIEEAALKKHVFFFFLIRVFCESAADWVCFYMWGCSCGLDVIAFGQFPPSAELMFLCLKWQCLVLYLYSSSWSSPFPACRATLPTRCEDAVMPTIHSRK